MSHRLRSTAALLSVAVFIAGLGLAGSASAAGLLASTTTLAASPSNDGNTLKLTATVTVGSFATGLIVSPSGSVYFSDNAHDNLGSVALQCALKACVISYAVTTQSLSDSVSAITATFSGDTIAQPSSASVPLLYVRCPPAEGNGASCRGSAAGGQTALDAYIAHGDTTLATLGATALPCSLGAGQVVRVHQSGNATDSSLVGITHRSAAVAAAYQAKATATSSNSTMAGHSAYLCAVSSAEFLGYWPGGSTPTFSRTAADFASFGDVPRLTSGPYAGYYVGLLADCYSSIGGFTVTVVHGEIVTTPPEPLLEQCYDPYPSTQVHGFEPMYVMTSTGTTYFGG